MGLTQFVLESVASRRLRAMERAAADPGATQEALLRDLLQSAANTEWGRQHGFAEMRDAAAYQKRVPLTTYEEMAPLWHRSFQGERDLAWPGHIKYFALSSGTTSGNKLLPVSHENLKSNKTSGLTVAALYLDLTRDRTFMKGKSLYLAGSAPLREEGHSLIGDASGIMLKFTPRMAHRYRLPTPEISSIGNWPDKMKALVDTSIDEDVRLVSACPSWVVLLFEELEREAERRHGKPVPIRELWPNLNAVVHFGMAWQPYRAALDRFVGEDMLHMETFSASEGGMFAITDKAGDDGLRLLIDNGIYYEFIPFSEIESEQPTRRTLAEVEEGKVYELVLTTNAGLWSYRLGDLVRFTSLSPHRVTMVGRSKLNLNAFGEHVIIEEMEEAVVNACRESGAECKEFTVLPVFPDESRAKPYHRWLIEFRTPPENLDDFGATVDRSIRKRNEDYDTHRTHDFGLDPPSIETVTDGTFYRWMESRGKLGGQHKVPRVLKSPSEGEELLALST